MNRIPKSITLSGFTWEKIDALRGEVPRSRFLERLVQTALKEYEK